MNTQRQLLRIAKVTQVNRWVRCFRLEPAQAGAALAPFQAGQYLSLFYQIGGTVTSRPYSIASSPKDAEMGFYELYIHGGGTFTAPWLFENGTEGSTVWASMPEGDFHYRSDRDTKKVIGISGGMSFTPLRSMAKAVADGTLDIDLTLFCGWDEPEEVLCKNEFQEYAAHCPNFRFVPVVANGIPAGNEHGYVTLDMLRRYADPQGATFFLCGPAAMYQSLAHELEPLHIPPQHYHQELPGEVKAQMVWGEPAGQAETYTLTVVHKGKKHRLPMSGRETVLTAMERGGLSPETRCRSGHCGFCLSRLTQGQVFVPDRWEKRSESETAHGLIHPCCSFPLSDLTLDLSGANIPQEL